MINKVTLVGNLGKDPEHTGKVCKFSMATTSSKKDGDQWVKVTEWHRVVCFGRTADNVVKYLSKGSQCFVEGRIQTNKWEDKDGNTRYTTEIIANEVKFLGAKLLSLHAQQRLHTTTCLHSMRITYRSKNR